MRTRERRAAWLDGAKMTASDVMAPKSRRWVS